jgi:hypothetical protein
MMTARMRFDWRWGLVSLGATVASLLGAYFIRDPGLRAACIAAGVALMSAAPSWAVHRGDDPNESP